MLECSHGTTIDVGKATATIANDTNALGTLSSWRMSCKYPPTDMLR
ncbi:MAG: hypothetical protein LBG97_10370 [Coriobacteriales bacterium]|nr:hypothetical protein [Coriobacteriales bacterium]